MAKQTHIVLIDDDQDACDLLKMQLEGTGRMNVTYSTSSEDALAVISRELPDIAILDINMPGTHGVALHSILAADTTTSSIPILYLSGMVTPDEAENMAKGENTPSIVSKGSPIEILIGAIDNLTSPKF